MKMQSVCGIVCVLFVLVATTSCDDMDYSRSRGLDAKSMLSSLASSLMSRGFNSGGGSSQVVSLNLTNLLVLVLLKALIFAAGSVGAGTWKGGYGRSSDGDDQLITKEEMLLYLGYITGSVDDYRCLQNIACNQPAEAKRYYAAGDILLSASKMLVSEEDRSYDNILKNVDHAIFYGQSGGDCNSRYVCDRNSV